MTLRCPYCSAEIDYDEDREYIGETFEEDEYTHETELCLNYKAHCPDCTEEFIWSEVFVYRNDRTAPKDE